jgi:hypothetical protein
VGVRVSSEGVVLLGMVMYFKPFAVVVLRDAPRGGVLKRWAIAD